MSGSRLLPTVSRPHSSGVADPAVACVFCREPIELSAFLVVARLTRRTTCPNCGLQVSVAASVWERWVRAEPAAVLETGLAERLRARRVAVAARVILDRVADTETE